MIFKITKNILIFLLVQFIEFFVALALGIFMFGSSIKAPIFAVLILILEIFFAGETIGWRRMFLE